MAHTPGRLEPWKSLTSFTAPIGITLRTCTDTLPPPGGTYRAPVTLRTDTYRCSEQRRAPDDTQPVSSATGGQSLVAPRSASAPNLERLLKPPRAIGLLRLITSVECVGLYVGERRIQTSAVARPPDAYPKCHSPPANSRS